MIKKKNNNKMILIIIGILLILVGIIIILTFIINNRNNFNGTLVCTLKANINENVNINNKASFTVENNNVINSRVTSTVTSTVTNDETFVEIKNYNTELSKGNSNIKDFYTIKTLQSNSFIVEENLTYNKNTNKLSLDISQMRANLLIPDYSEDNSLNTIRKAYQDYGYTCG